MKCIACLKPAAVCACSFHQPIDLEPTRTVGGDDVTEDSRRTFEEQADQQERYLSTGQLECATQP